MPDAHFKCTPRPVAPCAEKEPQGAAALRQADILQWHELVERSDGQHAPGEPPAARIEIAALISDWETAKARIKQGPPFAKGGPFG